MGDREHFAQFYETDAFLLEAIGEFIGAALRAGEGGIVVATPAHREGLEARLEAAGLDVAGARTEGQYVSLDAAETLSTFMVDGAPDAERFVDFMGGAIACAAAGRPHVRIFGEMVALLVTEGNPGAAVRLEALWHDLQKRQPFSLFCAYPLDSLGGQPFAELFDDVCAAHARVVPAESYAALTDPDDRSRAISVLQQRARSLAAEVARRERAEDRLQEALEAERAAREAAEAALRLRDDFLSVAAHELRTPLAGLRGMVQLAQRQLARVHSAGGVLDLDRPLGALRVADQQTVRLARLVDQLLEVSRLAPDPRVGDAAALVRAVAEGAKAWARNERT